MKHRSCLKFNKTDFEYLIVCIFSHDQSVAREGKYGRCGGDSVGTMLRLRNELMRQAMRQ
jgi:hypothetical protein